MKSVMKKIIFLGMILFLLGGGTPGCSKSKQQSVVGKWKEVDGTEIMEFVKDGTVVVTDEGVTMVGNYKLMDENRIKIEIGGIGALAGPGIAELSPSGEELLLKTSFGDTKYRRYTHEKTKPERDIKKPSKMTLRDRIPGNYILEGKDTEEWQGGFVFNEDATITRVLCGNWQMEDGQVKFYIPGIDVFSGTIYGDTLTTNGKLSEQDWHNRNVFLVPRCYRKKEASKLLVKTEKATVWSDYYVSPDLVKLDKDGTFLMTEVQPGTWKIENEFVQICASDGHKLRTNGRLEGADIVFEEFLDDKSLFVSRFIKQDTSVSPKKGDAKTGAIKPSKRNIPGKYVLQWEHSGEKGGNPGVFFFKDDGTATYILAGNWQIENGVLGLYEGSERVGGETVGRDVSIKTPYGMTDYIKKQGANPLGKSERITVWSEYVSPDNLKLKEDGIFFIHNRVRLRWEFENGSIQIYELWDNNLFGDGKLQGDDIVFERYDARFRKVDGDLIANLERMTQEFRRLRTVISTAAEELIQKVPGKYVFERSEGQKVKREEGDFVFNKDGTVTYVLSGKERTKTSFTWTIEDGSVKMYDDGDELFSDGKIESGNIVFDKFGIRARFIKEDGIQSPGQDKQAKFPAPQQQSGSKQELVNALADLESAIIKKIQLEVDVTAQCFTSVKEYKRAKLLADVLRPVLRVLQGTISVISNIKDATSLSSQVNTSLNNAQYVSEGASLIFMINGLRESGEKLYYAIDDTAGYTATVRQMLEKADETTVVRMDPDSYKKVIEQYLDSVEGTPLIIARTSELSADKKPAYGALALQRIIREEFRTLIDQIQRSEIPPEFSLKDAVSEIEELKHQIVESGTRNIDVHYSTYHRGGKTYQSRKLGAIAEHNRAFASIAGAVAERQRLEIKAEYAQLAGTGADIAYIVTYDIPGAREAAKVTQQATLLPGIVIEGKKTFTVDPEEEFYQMPQEMIFSLAIEFSNLLRISDDTALSLTNLLKETPSQIPSEPARITSEQPTSEQGKAITTVPDSTAPARPLGQVDRIIRGFGVWSSDWAGRHLGEDIEEKPETPVYPLAMGVVKFAKYQPEIGIGYGVIIEHDLSQLPQQYIFLERLFGGQYFCSVYYHMRQPKGKETLREGQTVSPEKPIGYISGEKKDHLSVPHLHRGIRKGKYLIGRDPRTNRWYYPGYTTIYNKKGIRQNDANDPIHNEIVKEWVNLSESISLSISSKSKHDIAKAKMAILEDALSRFYIDCGRYPHDSEGLSALLTAPADLKATWNGPYLERSILLDPWGNPYIYMAEGQYNPGGFDLISYGGDGAKGGEGDNADIVND